MPPQATASIDVPGDVPGVCRGLPSRAADNRSLRAASRPVRHPSVGRTIPRSPGWGSTIWPDWLSTSPTALMSPWHTETFSRATSAASICRAISQTTCGARRPLRTSHSAAERPGTCRLAAQRRWRSTPASVTGATCSVASAPPQATRLRSCSRASLTDASLDCVPTGETPVLLVGETPVLLASATATRADWPLWACRARKQRT